MPTPSSPSQAEMPASLNVPLSEDGESAEEDDGDGEGTEAVNLSSLSLDSAPPFLYTPDLPRHLRQVLLFALLHSLRSSVPPSGLSPSDESTLRSSARLRPFGSEDGCWFEDSDDINSYILDEWLWDERSRRRMLWTGAVPAFYCAQCRSTVPHIPSPQPSHEDAVHSDCDGDDFSQSDEDEASAVHVLVSPPSCPHCSASSAHLRLRTHITHSVNFAHLSLLFSSFLPSHIPDLQRPSFTLLDVGSRLGNVLYHAALTTACRSVGVESNGHFADLSRRLVEKYGLTSRVHIVEGRVEDREELVRSADLVHFFNPFELHCTRQEHRRLLAWLRSVYCHEEGRRSRWILSIPDMESIYERAGSDIDVGEWLERVDCCRDAVLYRVILV
jgi:hypothetical protein